MTSVQEFSAGRYELRGFGLSRCLGYQSYNRLGSRGPHMQPSIGPGEPESVAVIGNGIGELLQ